MRASLSTILMLVLGGLAPADAQSGGQFENARIEAVSIVLQGAVPTGAGRAVFEDRVRRTLDIYPGGQMRNLLVDFGLAKVRRLPGVASATANARDGATGGVVLSVTVILGPAAEPPGSPPFPYLYQADDSLWKLKLTTAGLGYVNRNAWYGQPNAFVGANPLATGPAGAGWERFVEGAFEAGLQGIAPIANGLYAYGSLTYLVSGSTGTDLFVSGNRLHGTIEDAYAGIVTGYTAAEGSRLVFNMSGGRQAYQIADGMLIRIVSANGFDRAALQLNPRVTADMLLLAQARYNSIKVELFRLDPDELPAIDTKTIIQGLNAEFGLGTPYEVGLTVLNVPRSDYRYFTPSAAGSREGLNVIDSRFYWLPTVAGQSGPFAKAEFAFQWNNRNDFPMRAWGGYIEGGYTFAALPWSPTVSYRLSAFSGDNPATRAYERWDPLFSGGSGEEWVQGLNHYKLVQDSNLVAHRLQARLKPAPQWELVPQFWLFQASQLNNLGGSVSTFAGRSLGYETNVTVKYFVSRNLFAQASVAMTVPLSGMQASVAGKLDPWFSAMTLVRMSY